MSDLVLIVPTRGRALRAKELVDQCGRTCTAQTTVVLAVDDDDSELAEYEEISSANVLVQHAANMVEALNSAAKYVLAQYDPFAIGFMGDDHFPVTQGWDATYLQALHQLGTGIVYGDDLFQGPRIPTQCAMTADIVAALGYMVPTTLVHMYADNFWADLGNTTGCLRYLSNVVIEHRHPIVHKAQWDDGYHRVNAQKVYDQDAVAYGEYLHSAQFAHAVAKVRGLRG